ncbi:ImmA/IrrE family metallo-endopeptidase [Lysobacter arenosi]|uniref:ImmA/IrrE family metallo-endopeptidase n=1 Tax=Lysobacter arenosi TaxID=2795387 RepID=A0ABX7R907_9GAMM|nr:ImmA/IrrE family metallo-endopeptidase [Lysobacter arenosi]QSX74230.1 ImmA/IrrE family metallo-endopeptidase [Lysobacter arenosi]
MDELTAISRARRLLEKHPSARAPVDIAAIAEAEGFEVKESDKLESGTAGMLLQRGGRKIIVVNKNDHPYRRRFTIAHELAHQILGLPSVHGARVPSDELERHGRRPKEEILCDVFAAECLVPWKLIQQQANNLHFTVETISELSELYEASKPCVASRFAQVSEDLLAYVPVESGTVRHAILSRSLRESGLRITVGIKVPRTSAVYRAMERDEGIAIVDIEGTDWSESGVAGDFSCHEEAFHVGDWDQGFTLLTFEEAPSSSDAVSDRDIHEDDERLSPLTGHLEWGKK